jgi:hypothetical protein
MVQKSDGGTPPEGSRDPFAPPPKDAPDRPWQPRKQPAHPPQRGYANENPQGRSGTPEDEDGHSDEPQRPVPPPHPWSPGHQGRPQQPLGYGPMPQGPRFDPSDPVQRKARYALLSGMWGIFFLILSVPYATLLLASLALYWSISALRGTPKKPVPPTAPTPTPYGPVPPYANRPQVPAAVGGLIASVVGLSLVAVVFGVQLYYKNFYDCQSAALTQKASDACATSVSPRPPDWLVQYSG